ncbi:MAG: alcohol dehydrogenase catalytic domain-containing protein, partial [Chloroflexi bacterium]|nr:alcohol dehydrogenase catalytic domain-containing protein [Chloroflexota bacterium]
MRAVIFDGKLKYITNHPIPDIPAGWARIRVQMAGICKTDMEIIKGYMGFTGILGHEFIGIVENCEDSTWIGKRVVGEINAACGKCDLCDIGLGRHCPNRTTLGILDLNGCMADYCVLPIANLREVPPQISDDRAVFTEPLSAACEILEQLKPERWERAIVLGDGRLGILCVWVLSTVLSDVTLIGHHPEKLKLAQWCHLKTADNIDEIKSG